MKDLFGYEKIRTLGLCQPFGSLMLHGKKESRKVNKKKKRPGFPLGKYLLYTTLEPYKVDQLEAMCGEDLLHLITETLVNEPTREMNGYAIVLADLVSYRLMVAADSRSAYVQYMDSLISNTWLLDFQNVKRIEPFEFEHGKQGIGFLSEVDKLKIKIL